MWKKFAKIGLVLATAAFVSGCEVYDSFANSSSERIRSSEWNSETQQYETRGGD